MLRYHLVDVRSAPNLNGKVALAAAKSAHEPVGYGDYFGIGIERPATKEVDIELPVLAEPPALRPLVAEHVRYRVEPEWVAKLPPPRGDHAGDRGRHLGPQCYLAATAVDKGVGDRKSTRLNSSHMSIS